MDKPPVALHADFTITQSLQGWNTLMRKNRAPGTRSRRQFAQGQVLDTPCVESRTLSQIVGAQVFLKFENLQFTASFKERGACNKLAQLTPEPSARTAWWP
jgi:threonine dehydratase